jgi:hypothetical protein
MSSPRTPATPPTASPTPTQLQHEPSDEENLANTLQPLPISAFSSDSSSDEEEEGHKLCTDDEYDVELGTARLLPMSRAPVRRLIIRRRKTAPVIPARPARRAVKRSVTAPASPIQGRITTPHPVSKRSTRRGATPPPAVPRVPKLVPERAEKRYGMVLPLTSKHIEAIKNPKIASPPPIPERSLKRTVVSISVCSCHEEGFVLEAVPVPKRGENDAKEERPSPPPLPERSSKRAEALRPVENNPSLREEETVVAPVAQRVPMKAAFFDPNSKFDLYSTSDSEKDEEEDEEDDVDWLAVHNMYEDIQAGRLVFPPSPEVPGLKAGSEARADEKEVFESQGKLFNMNDDGTAFRNPFTFEGGREVSEQDMDDVLSIVPSAPNKVRKTSQESIERAIGDESIHGLALSPKISPRTTEVEKTGEATGVAAPKPSVQRYESIGADPWSLKEEQVEEEEVEEQDDIVNPYGDQFAFPGGRWTVLSGERSLSRSSDYSAPSRLSSPIPRVRSRAAILYSPIVNPWHAEVMTAINEIAERQALDDSLAIFAGIDVDALVADAQSKRNELQNTDEAKGSLEFFHLAPHEPTMECGCQHCHKHYRPSREDLKSVHDPNEWCHCLACRLFRRKAEDENERAEQSAFWVAKFDELAAEVDGARVEEESRLLDLMDFKGEEEDADSFKPKKTHRLGDWVRRHLRSPCGE